MHVHVAPASCICTCTCSVRLILVMVLVVAYLLDLDDNMFQTFFGNHHSTSAPKGGNSFSQIKIGKRTLAACQAVRGRMTKGLVIAQGCLMFVVKIHPWMLMLWVLPILGFAMMAVTSSALPRIEGGKVGKELFQMVLTLGWIWSMRCIISPVCGESSRYFQGESIKDTYYVSILLPRIMESVGFGSGPDSAVE